MSGGCHETPTGAPVPLFKVVLLRIFPGVYLFFFLKKKNLIWTCREERKFHGKTGIGALLSVSMLQSLRAIGGTARVVVMLVCRGGMGFYTHRGQVGRDPYQGIFPWQTKQMGHRQDSEYGAGVLGMRNIQVISQLKRKPMDPRNRVSKLLPIVDTDGSQGTVDTYIKGLPCPQQTQVGNGVGSDIQPAGRVHGLGENDVAKSIQIPCLG